MNRRACIPAFHQTFAYQKRVGARFAHAPRVAWRENSAFRNHGATLGNLRAQALSRAQINLEALQIAVVDADEVRAVEERAFQFGFIVNFHQNVHSKPLGRAFELPDFPIFERTHNQQNAIGARQSRFDDLDFIDDEILAQTRFPRYLARRYEMFQIAQKPLRLGQNRQTIGERIAINRRLPRRIEIGRDDASGGRGFFDFGDETKAIRVFEMGRERAHFWRGVKLFFQSLEVGLRFERPNPKTCGGDNLIENHKKSGKLDANFVHGALRATQPAAPDTVVSFGFNRDREAVVFAAGVVNEVRVSFTRDCIVR